MNTTALLMILSMLTLASTNVWADDDGSYVAYDAIVSELKASVDEKPPVPREDWDEVALHAGIAFTSSMSSFNLPNGSSGSGLFKGLQFTAGVNLFSRDVRAEGVYSTYAHESIDSNMTADLKELEMRLIYSPRTASGMIARVGAGLSARYMDVNQRGSKEDTSFSATTPSTLLLFGLERKLNKTIALGPDLSYHSALASGTFDKSSWNASFHLNATF